MNIHQHKILILDFGSQYTQLIARRVRELGVYCEIVPGTSEATVISTFAPNGIILSGGPESVTASDSLRASDQVFQQGCPVLGICYGLQTMAQQLGGQVQKGAKREFGHAQVQLLPGSRLFAHLQNANATMDVWMSHGDCVTALPPDFIATAQSAHSPLAAIEHRTKPWFGVQFHPEVTHTPRGMEILSHFVHEICACPANWNLQNILEASIADIRARVGSQRVLVALSGGVDSSVLAVLLHQAIGEQLHCVFVDTGLLRKDETHDVMRIFQEQLHISVEILDAKQVFLSALVGVTDPEQKRKIVGEQFIRAFEKVARTHANIPWLAQGTIYPDVIESAQSVSGKAHVIKSHHNVGGLPKDVAFQLLEPLRELFKDEVRRLGLALGLPESVVYRHPFPGPGLALRIIGEITEERLQVLQQADAIFIEELRAAGLYSEVSQAFAVYLPIKSVGVKGDARCYEPVIALRAVKTLDFMTAHWAQLPYDFLAKVSNRLINEIQHISRVVYDISGKPPATIEWE